MNIIIAWIIIVIVHELGHYIGYRLFGLKPKIKLKGGFVLVYHPKGDELMIWQSFIVYSLGVVLGAIPLLMFTSGIYWIFVYYMVSTIDMAMIFTYIIYWRSYKRPVKDLELIIKEEVTKDYEGTEK